MKKVMFLILVVIMSFNSYSQFYVFNPKTNELDEAETVVDFNYEGNEFSVDLRCSHKYSLDFSELFDEIDTTNSLVQAVALTNSFFFLPKVERIKLIEGEQPEFSIPRDTLIALLKTELNKVYMMKKNMSSWIGSQYGAFYSYKFITWDDSLNYQEIYIENIFNSPSIERIGIQGDWSSRNSYSEYIDEPMLYFLESNSTLYVAIKNNIKKEYLGYFMEREKIGLFSPFTDQHIRRIVLRKNKLKVWGGDYSKLYYNYNLWAEVYGELYEKFGRCFYR